MLTHGISLAREAAEYFNAAASIYPSTAGRR